jgi:PST family polysaccharide transporter
MLKKIKKLFKSKDPKILIENFSSLAILQILNMILPLIVLPYVLRVLGITNYGIIILASSLVSYFHSITDYSFLITATRDISIHRDSIRKISFIYSKVMTIKTLILTVSIAVLFCIIHSYPPFYSEKKTFYLSILILVGHVLFPDWFFQGIEKMKYITIINSSVKIISTTSIFIFIKNIDDYWIYPLLISSGYIISGILAQIILFKKYKVKFSFIKIRQIKSTLKDNFSIFINQFLPNLYNNSTTFLLGIIVNSQVVGIYDAIKKVTDLGIILINLLSRTFFPYLNRNHNSFKKYLKLMLTIGIILTLGPIISHPFIFWYLKINYFNAFWILCLLSLGIFFISLYDIFGANYFIIKRKDKLVMKNTIFASIVGFLISFPLIYYFEIIGAAISLTIARGIMGGGLFYKYLKE